MQGKGSLEVILVEVLPLLEVTRVTLEDLEVTHRRATLEVEEVLQERLDPAILEGGPILHLREVTHPTVIPREDLEVIHPQVIPLDVKKTTRQ